MWSHPTTVRGCISVSKFHSMTPRVGTVGCGYSRNRTNTVSVEAENKVTPVCMGVQGCEMSGEEHLAGVVEDVSDHRPYDGGRGEGNSLFDVHLHRDHNDGHEHRSPTDSTP